MTDKDKARKLVRELINYRLRKEGKQETENVKDNMDIVKSELNLIVKQKIHKEQSITWERGRCSAHKYIINVVGKKNYITFKCMRRKPVIEVYVCPHYSDIYTIIGKAAECWTCGGNFEVKDEHLEVLGKNMRGENSEGKSSDKLTCGCDIVVH